MHPYAPKSAQYGPEVVARLIQQIDPAKYDLPTHPDRFTPRQVVCHLAIWEGIMDERMGAAYAGGEPMVPNWDEEADVALNRYDEKDMDAMLSQYREKRAAKHAWLTGLSVEEMQRAYVHESVGRLTIEDGMNLLIAHDMYHVAQLADLLAS
jgi:hypothetical protein